MMFVLLALLALLLMTPMLIVEMMYRSLDSLNEDLISMDLNTADNMSVNLWVDAKEKVNFLRNKDKILFIRGLGVLIWLSIVIIARDAKRIILVKKLILKIKQAEQQLEKEKSK